MSSSSQPSKHHPDGHTLFLCIEACVILLLLFSAISFAGYWGVEKAYKVWIHFVARDPIADGERIEMDVLVPDTSRPSGKKITLEAHVVYPGAEPYYTVIPKQ